MGRGGCGADGGGSGGVFKRLGFDAADMLDGGGAEQRKRLYCALVFLESHLGSRIGVKEIAAAASYTPRHFQRLFQEVFHERARAYLTRLRMRKAAQLLEFHDMPVLEVAQAEGIKEIPGGLMMHDFKGTAAAIEARWHLLCDVWLPRSGFKPREEYSFDLFAPHQMTPRKLAAIMAARDPVVESTLCVPVSTR